MDLSVIGSCSLTLSSSGVLLGTLLFPGTLNSSQKKKKSNLEHFRLFSQIQLFRVLMERSEQEIFVSDFFFFLM